MLLNNNSYWFTRIIFLRSLSFIYIIAFMVAKFQNIQLIGYNGLTPADIYMDEFKSHMKTTDSLSLFLSCPTILWFFTIENGSLNFYLDLISWLGIILSLSVFLSGKANMVIMFILWLMYHSIVNIGQTWYSFGWESQLLETGFIGIFMCNFVSLKMFSLKNKPSFIPILLNRWLIFRIMIGAGMIKIRGDKCWRDLTCMNYHYETQPIPNPISYYLHQEPAYSHKIETLMNHFIELVCPWLILLPRPLVKVGGIIQIIFQIVLIISGNLSFLNWLTILPSICCFEDKDLQILFSNKLIKKVNDNNIQISEKLNKNQSRFLQFKKVKIIHLLLLLLIGFLSIPVIKNIFSRNQIMNTSFDSFRLVNTYGAFGSVTKERTEIIIEGSLTMNPHLKSAKWKPYEFFCKPGNLYRKPCFISPYHYRLDWLMWFAAFQKRNQNVWLFHLIYKFLKNDKIADELIANNPFKGDSPPNWIRALHYKYEFCKFGECNSNYSQWWKRKLIGEYMQPVNLNLLKEASKSFRWNR